MKRIILALCLLLMILPLFAEEELPPNDIQLADVPIYYGEADFTKRILERTNGERDPIGLVLTGGSARAFAHIGILQYLEEQGIEPDFIVSNSMGSIIALLYSAGVAPEQILEIITCTDLSAYFNLTVPLKGGLLDQSGFEGLISSVVGKDVDLKDLPIPVMVVCEDLVTKREIRICEGDFNNVMLASFALPVYFPPQEYKGHLLIDGGIKSLAPIDVAYQYSDTIICSTTFYDVDTLNLRNPITILNGSFDVNKRYNAAASMREHIDNMIWIRCAVEQFSFMAFDKSALMAEIGYESAEKQSEALLKLYKHGISKEIVDNRITYTEALEKARNGLYFFNHIEQLQPSNTISFAFKSHEQIDSLLYLNQSFDFGLQYQFSHRKLVMDLLAGASSLTQVRSQNEVSPMLSFSLDCFPISRLRLSFNGSVKFDNPEKFYVPSIYGNESLVFKFYSDDRMEFGFNQTFEVGHDFLKGSETEYAISTGFDGQVPFFSSRLKFRANYLGLGKIRPNVDYRSFLDLKLNTRMQFKALGGTYIDLGFLSRFAIDGKNGVRLFYNDGFLTNVADYYSSSNSGSSEKYLFMLPFSVGYSLPFAPTFAEVLILKAFEVGGYCDLLFNGPILPQVSTGVEVKMNLSLIGLQSFPFTVRIGYDTASKAMLTSFRFAVL